MCIQPPASDNGSIHRWLAAWVQHTAGCDATGSCASVSCSTHIWLTIVIVGHLLYLAFFFFFFLLHITQAVVRSPRKSSCSFG